MYPSTRTERLGLAAGVASALVWVAILAPQLGALVGGRLGLGALGGRLASVSGGAAMVATLVVGLVAGVAYARGDHGGFEWAEVARAIYYGPLAVFGGVLALVVLAFAVQGLASGGLAGALVTGLVTLVVGLFAGAVLAIGLGAVVAVPAVVGVYAGVRVGRELGGASDGGRERDSPWAGDSDVPRTGSTGGGGVGPAAGWRERLLASAPWNVERASPERYGWWAGVAATVAVLGPLLFGPGSTLRLTLGGGTPIAGSPSGNAVALLGGAAVAALAGFLAVARYDDAVERRAAKYRRKMVWQAALAPMMLALVAVLGVLVADALVKALSGQLGTGLAGVVGAVLGGMLVGPAAGVIAAVVVGTPTVVGVFLGDASVQGAGR